MKKKILCITLILAMLLGTYVPSYAAHIRTQTKREREDVVTFSVGGNVAFSQYYGQVRAAGMKTTKLMLSENRSDSLTVPDKTNVVLDLNGYKLTGTNSGDSVITVGRGATLNIYDEKLSGSVNSSSSKQRVVLVKEGGTLIVEARLYGNNTGIEAALSALFGNNTGAKTLDGAVVYLEKNAKLVIKSGVLAYGNAKKGGAVYLSNGASMEVVNGGISGCQADYGGAIYSDHGIVSLQSGNFKIEDCQASQKGGAIYLEGDPQKTHALSTTTCQTNAELWCEIKNCKAESGYGGGIYSNGVDVTLKQRFKLHDCTADYGSGIYLAGNGANIIMTGNAEVDECSTANKQKLAPNEDCASIVLDGTDLKLNMYSASYISNVFLQSNNAACVCIARNSTGCFVGLHDNAIIKFAQQFSDAKYYDVPCVIIKGTNNTVEMTHQSSIISETNYAVYIDGTKNTLRIAEAEEGSVGNVPFLSSKRSAADTAKLWAVYTKNADNNIEVYNGEINGQISYNGKKTKLSQCVLYNVPEPVKNTLKAYDARMTSTRTGSVRYNNASVNSYKIMFSHVAVFVAIGEEHYETVQDALDAAANGDVITLMKDVEGQSATLNRAVSVTIDLSGRAWKNTQGTLLTINNSQAKAKIIDSSSAKTGQVYGGGKVDSTGYPGISVVSGSLEIVGGKYASALPKDTAKTADDSVIRVSGGTLTIKDASFSNCYAQNGGAIKLTGGTTTIGGSTKFVNCFANTDGGAINSADAAVLTVTDKVSFSACEAGGNGGAIFGYSATVSGNVKFDKCKAKNGGTIATKGSKQFKLTDNVVITDSNATNFGGAIYAEGPVTLSGKISLSGLDKTTESKLNGTSGTVHMSGSTANLTVEGEAEVKHALNSAQKALTNAYSVFVDGGVTKINGGKFTGPVHKKSGTVNLYGGQYTALADESLIPSGYIAYTPYENGKTTDLYPFRVGPASNKLTVTFNPNYLDGTSITLTGYVDFGINVTKEFKRTGYFANHWSTVEDETTTKNFKTFKIDDTIYESCDLYMQWVRDPNSKWKVVYETKVFGAPVPIEYTDDTITVLSPEALGWSRPSYNFVGFNVKKDLNGKIIKPGTKVRINSSTGVLELYEMWEAKQGTIVARGEQRVIIFKDPLNETKPNPGSMDMQFVTKESTLKLTNFNFTRDGYLFDSWNTKADGSGTSYKMGDVLNLDSLVYNVDKMTSLYAQWTTKSVTAVTMPDDGGTSTVTLAFADTEVTTRPNNIYYVDGKANRNENIRASAKLTSIKIDECVFVYPGATFKYWSARPDGSGVQYHPGDMMEFEGGGNTIYLYAIWEYDNPDDDPLKGAGADPSKAAGDIDKQAEDIKENAEDEQKKEDEQREERNDAEEKEQESKSNPQYSGDDQGQRDVEADREKLIEDNKESMDQEEKLSQGKVEQEYSSASTETKGEQDPGGSFPGKVPVEPYDPTLTEEEIDAQLRSDCLVVKRGSYYIYVEDALPNQYYSEALIWAIKKGFADGYTQTYDRNGNIVMTFGTLDVCTRAQMITLIWNMYGKQQPISESSKFVDVVRGSYYEQPVIWATENGVTDGTGYDTFSPDLRWSKAQAVTMCWKILDRPDVAASNVFEDVNSQDWYYEAVAWASKNGVLLDSTVGKFDPNADCTRAEMITYLYNSLKSEF